ncbi:MAG: methyltransferase domain-containing protein [Gemmatimonadales bacterium]|nr:methyltransferase domain-containing protein [Gemmatimonadales bacterium]
MPEWFEEWFGEEYLQLYPHRDEAEADRAVRLVTRATGLQPGWRVLDVGCGAGRHARAFRSAGARCYGVDLSLTLLRIAGGVTDAPLVRADMRRLPIRPGSMDLTVSLFTSFGYFERDEEHAGALAEMAATLRPGGWFVIDFLNAAEVRARLVPRETVAVLGGEVDVRRSVSPDGHYVCKTIVTPGGRRFVERVRLFESEEIADLLGEAGVEVRHRFGDYDAGPLRAGSPRTIMAGSVA